MQALCSAHTRHRPTRISSLFFSLNFKTELGSLRQSNFVKFPHSQKTSFLSSLFFLCFFPPGILSKNVTLPSLAPAAAHSRHSCVQANFTSSASTSQLARYTPPSQPQTRFAAHPASQTFPSLAEEYRRVPSLHELVEFVTSA